MSATRPSGSWSRRLADAAEPYLYTAPAVILIVAVMLVPLLIGISYAFRDVRLLNPFSGGYVGLAHFQDLAGDKAFARALLNTLWWAGGSVVMQFLFGFILALLLERIAEIRGGDTWRNIVAQLDTIKVVEYDRGEARIRQTTDVRKDVQALLRKLAVALPPKLHSVVPCPVDSPAQAVPTSTAAPADA